MTNAERAREAARNRTTGQFGEQVRSEPEVTLDTLTESESTRLFDEAIGYWPQAAEMPELHERWVERFAALNVPRGESVAEAAEELLGLHELYGEIDRVRVEENARGLSVHVAPEDEWDTQTYVHHVSEGPDANRLRAAVSNDEAYSALWALRHERSQYTNGTYHIWNLLEDQDRVTQLRNDVSEADSAVVSLSYEAKHGEEFLKCEEFMKQLVKKGEVAQKDRTAAWNQTLRGPWKSRGENERVLYAAETLMAATEARKHLTQMEAARAEAEALPPGHLRDFLLAPRPEQTYDTYTGTGRNKRLVKKKYTPRSELEQEFDKAQTTSKSLIAKAETLQAKLDAWRGEHQENIDKHRAAAERRDSLRRQLLEAGLPPGIDPERVVPVQQKEGFD